MLCVISFAIENFEKESLEVQNSLHLLDWCIDNLNAASFDSIDMVKNLMSRAEELGVYQTKNIIKLKVNVALLSLYKTDVKPAVAVLFKIKKTGELFSENYLPFNEPLSLQETYSSGEDIGGVVSNMIIPTLKDITNYDPETNCSLFVNGIRNASMMVSFSRNHF